jgi:hypothetical protein
MNEMDIFGRPIACSFALFPFFFYPRGTDLFHMQRTPAPSPEATHVPAYALGYP